MARWIFHTVLAIHLSIIVAFSKILHNADELRPQYDFIIVGGEYQKLLQCALILTFSRFYRWNGGLRTGQSFIR